MSNCLVLTKYNLMNALIIHLEINYLCKRTCWQLHSPEDCETNMKLRVANKINEIALLYRLERNKNIYIAQKGNCRSKIGEMNITTKFSIFRFVWVPYLILTDNFACLQFYIIHWFSIFELVLATNFIWNRI